MASEVNSAYTLTILNYLQIENFFDDSNKDRKRKMTRYFMENMLRRTQKMFTWNGLPDTITQRNLELIIQTRGVAGIVKDSDGALYAVWGGLGGLPNVEYMPSDFIVANPYMKTKSKVYKIYGPDRDCVVIPNDSIYRGLNSIFSYHSELLTEINITKLVVYINERFPSVFTAPDNNSYKDVIDFLNQMKEGKLASILDKNLLKDIQILSNNTTERNSITQLLEAEQYQKAALFNDLGLQLNYNMKRETITSSEAQLGESALLPLCDDMLEQRKLACDRLKEVFDLDVTVEFSSAWSDLRKSIELEMKVNENEANSGVQSTEQTNENENVQSTEQGENNET